jgi:hypothetical protein
LRRIFALATTLAIALTGLTALPSWASAPQSGTYDCNTGVRQNTPSDPSYTILNGVVSGGAGCVGVVEIPAGAISIQAWSFVDAVQVTQLNIPASVTSIGEGLLYRSTRVEAINVDTASADYSSTDGVLFDKTQATLIKYPQAKLGVSYSIPGSVTNIARWSFINAGLLTNIQIPPGVTYIGDGSFARTSITAITLPAGLTEIQDYTFEDAPISGITVPQGVTKIGRFAFHGATHLATVSLPTSLNLIDVGAFQGASTLNSVDIPEGVASIGDYAFYETYALQTVHLPSTLHSIGTRAFSMPDGMSQYAGSLTSVNLPDGLTTIGESAFRETKITSVTIPGSVTNLGIAAFAVMPELTSITILPGALTTIGPYAFSTIPKLASITLPDNITVIADGAFCQPSEAHIQSLVTSIRLPSNLTSIGSSAFLGHNGITSITIPAGVTSIGDQAFAAATSLTSVSFAGPVAPAIGYGAFAGITTAPTTTIPLTTTGVGVGAGWSGLQVTRPNGAVTCGGGGTFTVTNGVVTGSTSTCSGAVAVPYGITSVGWAAFWTRQITSVSIPNTVTTIASHAFRQTALTSVTIPASVQSIGELSFGTTPLTQLTFDAGSSLTSIGDYAFQSSQFTTVTIPASVTSISNTAFQANVNLASIHFSGTIPAGWPWSASANVLVSGNVSCGATGYFVISDNTVIGRRDCTGSVIIPEGVTAVGVQAFDAAQEYGRFGRGNPYGSTIETDITSLTIPNTVTSIGDFAFRHTHIT